MPLRAKSRGASGADPRIRSKGIEAIGLHVWPSDLALGVSYPGSQPSIERLFNYRTHTHTHRQTPKKRRMKEGTSEKNPYLLVGYWTDQYRDAIQSGGSLPALSLVIIFVFIIIIISVSIRSRS